MKYYSELLNEMFDTPEQLAEAESKKTTKKKKSISETTEKTVVEEPTRKELATAVEAADEKVKEAYANYDAAKVKAEEVSKKYLQELNAILEPAKKAVKDAETNRFAAIKAFNDSYGTYQVSYTGARAAEEWAKSMNNINSMANRIFRDLLIF